MSFTFGPKSEAQLATVEEPIVRVARRALTLTRDDFGAFEGVRDIERQRQYVRDGKSMTMKSRHLPNSRGKSEAIDLVPWIQGRFQWDEETLIRVCEAMLRACEMEGVVLVSGACWMTTTEIRARGGTRAALAHYKASKVARGEKPFVDLPHWQLPPV